VNVVDLQADFCSDSFPPVAFVMLAIVVLLVPLLVEPDFELSIVRLPLVLEPMVAIPSLPPLLAKAYNFAIADEKIAVVLAMLAAMHGDRQIHRTAAMALTVTDFEVLQMLPYSFDSLNY
jgi:hypothetical protein